jgi:protein-S-isoprenylcysteine O-methyltransferase Ste14
VKRVLPGIIASGVSLAVVGAILFGCAGRWDVPTFWVFLAVWMAAGVAGAWVIDPDLIAERVLPGPGGRDYGWTALFLPLALGQFVVAGLDVGRYHWSDTVPLAVQVVGLVAMGAALAVAIWASAVNRFFSSVIRIQTERGHRVVTSGPYRFVRHPAYAVAPFLLVGTGLALSSWLAAAIGVLMMPLLLRRTVVEDRILREELTGYADYAARVRYRLLPGVW